jgi:hypothetical protein
MSQAGHTVRGCLHISDRDEMVSGRNPEFAVTHIGSLAAQSGERGVVTTPQAIVGFDLRCYANQLVVDGHRILSQTSTTSGG